MIKAIIFDIDGTLLDTSEFILKSFEHALSAHNLPKLERDTLKKRIGPPLFEAYKAFAPHIDSSLLVETHRTFQEQNLHLSIPFEKTLITLQTLKDKGIKMAAVTNRSKRTSLKTLELAGIDHFFEIVLSAEDVTHEKPHPEGVLKALKHLGVNPEEVLMVGDTHADVGAGRAANIKIVGTTQGIKGEDILSHNPDHVIYDISELLLLIN